MPLILKNKLSFAFKSVSEKKEWGVPKPGQDHYTQRFVRQTALTIELDNVVWLEAAETVQQTTIPVFILFSIGDLLLTEIQAFMHLEDEC